MVWQLLSCARNSSSAQDLSLGVKQYRLQVRIWRQVACSHSNEVLALVVFSMSQQAAETVMSEANIKHGGVRVYKLNDCFFVNEIFTIEALDLASVGKT